jgi:hypothetical protein
LKRGTGRGGPPVEAAWRRAAERSIFTADSVYAAKKQLDAGRSAELYERLVSKKRAGFWLQTAHYPWLMFVMVSGTHRPDWLHPSLFAVGQAGQLLLIALLTASLSWLFVDLCRDQARLDVLCAVSAGETAVPDRGLEA